MSEESKPPDTVIVEVNTGDQSSDIDTPEIPAEPPAAPVVIVENVNPTVPDTPGSDPMDEVRNRFEVVERRLDAVEQTQVQHASDIAGRAEAAHSHSLPPVIEALQENLEAVEAEEVAPQKVPFYKRKLF